VSIFTSISVIVRKLFRSQLPPSDNVLCVHLVFASLSVCLSIYLSMVLYSLLSRFFSFLNFYTDSSTPWMGHQPVSRPLPTRRTKKKHRIKAYRHPCLEWVSNPRSQCSSGRPLWSAICQAVLLKYFLLQRSQHVCTCSF
jgi:hypothetical protein